MNPETDTTLTRTPEAPTLREEVNRLTRLIEENPGQEVALSVAIHELLERRAPYGYTADARRHVVQILTKLAARSYNADQAAVAIGWSL